MPTAVVAGVEVGELGVRLGGAAREELGAGRRVPGPVLGRAGRIHVRRMKADHVRRRRRRSVEELVVAEVGTGRRRQPHSGGQRVGVPVHLE